MEELYVFGTGNAQATRCYNTCFAIKDGDEFFMVDAGGGNGILGILEKMNVDMAHIHHIFVTHEHRHCHEKRKIRRGTSHLLPSGTGRYDLYLMPFNTSGEIL